MIVDPSPSACRLVVDQLTTGQLVRTFGHDHRGAAVEQLSAERARLGPVPDAVLQRDLADATRDGAAPRPREATAAMWAFMGLAALFLLMGVAMVVLAATKVTPPPLVQGTLFAGCCGGLVLGPFARWWWASATRRHRRRTRESLLEWASHRPGQLARGLPALVEVPSTNYHYDDRLWIGTGIFSAVMALLPFTFIIDDQGATTIAAAFAVAAPLAVISVLAFRQPGRNTRRLEAERLLQAALGGAATPGSGPRPPQAEGAKR